MAEYSWAELGGVRLHGDPGEQAPFYGLMLTRIRGWRGLPGARGDAEPIPGAQGMFGQEEILREGRSMELLGAVVAPSVQEASAMLAQLETACAARSVEMRVSDADGIWTRTVEVEVMTPADAWNRRTVTFTLDLFAPDPIRYRDPVTEGPIGLPTREGGLVLPSAFPWDFGESIVPVLPVENIGAVPLLPVVRVRGSGTAVTVYGGPRRVSFGAFSGELVIDNEARRAWLNGAEVTLQLVRRDWQQVPEGGVQDFYFDASDPSPGTHMTVDYEIGAW